MASWADVERLCGALPEVEQATSYGARAWRVKGRTFAWERPLRARDLAELGDAAPDSAPLAVRVADEGVKQALLADDPGTLFTTAHFHEFACVLVRLDRVEVGDLEELLVDGWLAMAPARVRAAHPDVAPPVRGGG